MLERGGPPLAASLAASSLDETAAVLFIDIAVIVVVARVVGSLARRVRQPAVVGEIIGGILLGPTLLGALPGDLTDRLFPTDVRPFLRVVAQLGLIVFMFIVGLELDLGLIRGKERVAAAISLSSVALPFGLGLLLAMLLHPGHEMVGGKSVQLLPFSLFIGASMSVTAFPVLARILTERGMYRTPIGALTLACAAVDDIVAWSLLALVLAVVASTGLGDLPRILVESIAFVAAMFVIVRPLLERVARRYRSAGRLTPDVLAVVLVGILASSYVTAKIGIHQIFGAFLFGVVMPRRGTAPMFHEILDRLEHFTVLLLLPIFFMATGLDANVRQIGIDGLGELGFILFVACAGKFAGASLSARGLGVPWRRAAAIGTLMNTRGLTELVILNVGLAFGVLDLELFTLLVVMAVFTTVITEPVLRIVYPASMMARDLAEADRKEGSPGAFTIVVAVGNLDHAPRLVDAALDIIGDESPAELVLMRFVPLPPGGEIQSGLVAELADQATISEGLRALAERAEKRGARAIGHSQLSDDFARDLVAHVDAVGAHAVVLGWQGTSLPTRERALFVRRVLRDAPCDVVVLIDPLARGVAGGPDLPLVVTAGEGFHNIAALDLAVRVARSRGAALHIVDVADGDAVERSRRLAELAGHVQRVGPGCTPHLAPDGVTAEAVRLSEKAALVAAGIDEEWFHAGGTFGRGTDELVARAKAPVAVVRARYGLTRAGWRGLIERLQGRGREDEAETRARLAAAGPEPTYGDQGVPRDVEA